MVRLQAPFAPIAPLNAPLQFQMARFQRPMVPLKSPIPPVQAPISPHQSQNALFQFPMTRIQAPKVHLKSPSPPIQAPISPLPSSLPVQEPIQSQDHLLNIPLF